MADPSSPAGSHSTSSAPDVPEAGGEKLNEDQKTLPSADSEELLQRVRNLMRRITAARPSPHPRFLHNLASILEQEEARFENNVSQQSSNNARLSHTIGRLVSLVRENDDFFELLSTKLLLESRHSMAVQAAAARLLLACLSCGMYSDAFDDAVIANIKRWVIEDTPKPVNELSNPTKLISSKSRNLDWEMLRTYNLGLLAVALTAGGGTVEEVLASGVAAKLMHYLRLRVLKEGSSQKDMMQVGDVKNSLSSVVKNREDLRSRARLSVDIPRSDCMREGGECSENQTKSRERVLSNGPTLQLHGGMIDDCEPFLERSKCFYNADVDTDWMSEDKWLKKEKKDVKCKNHDVYSANRATGENEGEEACKGESSKRRDVREKTSLRLKGKAKGTDGIVDGDRGLTSPNANAHAALQCEKNKESRGKVSHKALVEANVPKLSNVNHCEDIDFDATGAEKEPDEDDGDSIIVGGVDISVHIRKAAKAAEAEAKAARASLGAVMAAGEAAAELVKAAALEVLGQTQDEESIMAAAMAAAATVMDAAMATNVLRKNLDFENEEGDDKEDTEVDFAQLDDCIPDVEHLVSLRERYSVQCLERLGEYLEVLGPVLHERGVDVCLALLQRESADGAFMKDTAILSDVLKLICALAAHRKFSALFVDRGGVKQILAVPRLPQTYTGISLCLFAFASVQGVMERVCTAPPDVLNDVVNLGLHLLECAQDPARRNAALFFGAAFVFRAILDVFDAQGGLSKMLNLLRNASAIRSGTGLPASSRNDRAASAEVLTSSEKQIAFHTCVALRQYFRAHLLLLVESLRPSKGRTGMRSFMSGHTSYKPIDLSNENIDTVVLQIQRDRKLGPVFVRARWPAFEKFMSCSGHLVLLELMQVSPGERYLHDIAQHALGILQIVTLMPYARRLIVNSTLSNERPSMAVILDAASVTSFSEPEVIQSTLMVLVNMVCPPPSLSSRSNILPTTPGAYQQNFGPSSGNGIIPAKVDGVLDKNAMEQLPQVAASANDNKERASKGEGTNEKASIGTPGSHSQMGVVSPAVVGDRRISLGPVAGGSGLAAYMEQGYHQAREVVRANNGIKVLLHLLSPRTVLSPMSLDCIRALACRVLLGLAKDDAIAHILTKLQVGKLLSELLREGNNQLWRATPANGTGDQGHWQAELGQVSMELMAVVTNAGRASTLAASDAAAPTLRRIERAAIAAATPISYPARELLQLIHEHLVQCGLSKSASTLLNEAQLMPLPSTSLSTFSSQASTTESVHESFYWPTGCVPSGFMVETNAKDNDLNSTSDHSIRKKGPCFSSSFRSALVQPQLGVKEAPEPFPESTHTPNMTDKAPDFHISGTRLADNDYSEALKASTTSIHLAYKRKYIDKDACAIAPPNKRHVVSDPEGLPSKNIQSQPVISVTLSQSQQDITVRPESLDLSQLHNDLELLGQPSFNTTIPSNSWHPYLCTDSQAYQTERATLDSLVVQYLKHQHRQCPAPISTLPPLSLLHPHICPEPTRAGYAPLNTARRLSVREMIPPHGGMQGRKRGLHFVYSRFRPLRLCRDENVLLTTTAFLGTTFRLAVGSHAGEIRLFDCHSGNMLEAHVCHQSSITSMQCSFGELSGSQEFTGSPSNQLLLSSANFDVKLWNASALGDVPLYSFDGCRSARFNHSGSIFAAISSEMHREVLLYDVQTGKLEQRLSDGTLFSAMARGSSQCIPHFNASDTLLLWNGVLWDHRLPRAIRRFDQFTDYGGGGFHPAGNEVIINSEVWDLRAFKLLRSVPSLDQTSILFNPSGDIIYAILRRNSEDLTSALHPRRGKNPLFSAFKTLDAVDYSDIATTPVDRCVLDLAIEPSDTLISVVALDGHDEMDSFVKLYEVGRRKPTDDDSDPDDGVETEDDEDSLAEEEAVDEEVLHGDGDDSDLDASNDGTTGDDDEAEEADADFDTNDDDDDDMVEVEGTIVELFSDGNDDVTRISYSSGDEDSTGDFNEDFNEMLQGFF